MKGKTMLLALLFAVPGVTFAADAALDVAAQPFSAQRAQIEADLSDGKTYAEIAPEDRRTVNSSLERMTELLGGAHDANALGEDARMALFNEQEVVNTILTRARADSRVVCRKRAPVGTRFAQAKCESVADARRKREESQEGMRQQLDVPRLPPSP
jgi:hypothetical protein